MRSQRINSLQEYIFEKNLVSLRDLCDHFGVSLSTLRRDLAALDHQGLIKKTYGGVAAQSTRQLITPYEERDIIHREAKWKIARAAAGLVNNGDIIFIDSGSTAMGIVDFLGSARNVTILTNNINAIVKSLPLDNIRVITLSGLLNRRTRSFTGESAAKILLRYNINKSFMGTTGVSITNGVTNSSSTEVEIKTTAVQRCQQNILLADSSKIGVISLFTYCQFDQVDAIVTEKSLPDPYMERLRKNQATAVIAD
jgi:DeoR family myo-inositol catabolism operon transcriptional repressor